MYAASSEIGYIGQVWMFLLLAIVGISQRNISATKVTKGN